MSFHAQHGEDAWVAVNIPLPAKGVAIEVGAGDGVALSNTLHWEEDCGWDGFLVEPDPRNLSAMKWRRRWPVFPFAVSSVPGRRDFRLMPEPTHSGLIRDSGEVVQVECVTLQSLIDRMELTGIDLLSIDVEGTELDVWRSLDNERLAPTVLIIEHWTQGLEHVADNEVTIIREMAGRYELRHRTECNLIFELR